MKNLPEKIYLNLNMTPQEVVETKNKDFHETTKTWEITWSEECLSEHDPEYVRKGVLIERACEFIAENMTCNGYTLQTKAKFIKEFKDYMKGK